MQIRWIHAKRMVRAYGCPVFPSPLRVWTALSLMLGCLPALAVDAEDSPTRSGAPPNVIFILADDLGYGDLGSYGQQQIETPRLDRLAREGLRFTQHYAGSTVCAPSRCVLMTGLHTGHCYIRGNGKHNFRPSDVTVADLLQRAGYATALCGKWGLGHEGSPGIPTRQGFDHFFGYLDQHMAHNYYPSYLVLNERRVPLNNVVPNEGKFGQGVATERVDYSHDLIVENALEWIDAVHDQPFFLFLALTIPHANNEAGKEGMEVPDYGSYATRDWPRPQKGLAAMITRMDRDVGRVLDRLTQHNIDRQTLVLFSSDNGPHREGGNDPDFFDSNGPLRGIKRDLYEGGIRVPLLARWPGTTPAGAITDHLCYFGDLMATVAELADISPPDEIDSVSFAPTLTGQSEQQREHDYLYWEFYERNSRQAVRETHWKAIRQPMFTGPIELYDLQRDAGEEADLAAQYPDVVRRLASLMDDAHRPSPDWKVKPVK